MKYLIDCGADVNATDDVGKILVYNSNILWILSTKMIYSTFLLKGSTPLHRAAEKGP